MPGPSSDSNTNQTRGPATPGETAFSDIALAQSGRALDAFGQAVADPRIQAQTIDQDIAAKQTEFDTATENLRLVRGTLSTNAGASVGGYDKAKELESVYARQVANASSSIRQLQAQKTVLPKQVEDYEQTQSLRNRTGQRMLDILEGRDIGVSPQEQALITQGISGISQDVATTRGLNRSDVPVMQAIAPAVSNALLQQANANRSLFTGINQFQQGMDLSGRQLQAGLAGQNPAANLTGVYAGLRPSSFSTNTQQGYGALDYVNAGANAFKAVGQGVAGFKGAPTPG